MKQFYALMLLIFFTVNALSQNIFETVGNPLLPTSVKNYTGWSDMSINYAGTAEVQINNPSYYHPNYIPASGNGNVFFTYTKDTYLQISGLPYGLQPSYGSITFGMFGYDTSNPDILNELELMVSTDSGSTWQSLPYYRTFKGYWSPQPWDIFTGNLGEVTNASRVMFKFIQTTSSKTFIIDDIHIQFVILLPIKLISFNASAKNNQVVITWRAATLTNRETFIIEKSLNGETFLPLKKIMAKGNGEFNYELIDELKGKTFYRLKMISADGKVSYSNIETVNSTPQLAPVIFPNPTKIRLHIQLNSRTVQQIFFYITDIKGQQRLKQVAVSNVGLNSYDLNIQSLPAGIYHLTVITSDGRFTEKVVVTD